MAGSINKVILVGNLGRDPEFRTMQQSGGRVCQLSVATSESWKDKQTNDWKEKTEWHRVVIFNEALINRVERNMKKGTKVYVEGQLETRNYTDKNGQEKYTTEIVLRPFRGEITSLDKSGGGAANDSYDSDSAPSFGGSTSGGMSKAVGADMDDEIPF
ncbi:MAG: single-stranded DNA-binding protein [Bdellovibrionales bacterium]